MLNHIVIMGRFTRDPELRYTQSQIPVASFTVAVDRDFADKQSGERQTDFIDCVAWRSTAEFVSKYFFKGGMAVVSGRLQLRDWTDRDGNKRRSAEIVADNVYFGEAKRRDSADNSGGGYSNQGGYSSQGSYSQQSGYGAAPQHTQPSGYTGGYRYSTDHGAPAQQAGLPPQNPQTSFADLEDGDGDLPF